MTLIYRRIVMLKSRICNQDEIAEKSFITYLSQPQQKPNLFFFVANTPRETLSNNKKKVKNHLSICGERDLMTLSNRLCARARREFMLCRFNRDQTQRVIITKMLF